MLIELLDFWGIGRLAGWIFGGLAGSRQVPARQFGVGSARQVGTGAACQIGVGAARQVGTGAARQVGVGAAWALNFYA